MHGDISQPADAIITKDDYESYNLKRQLFTTTLQGDLISKTFLFIGFSFEDPNLEYILSRIRILLGENQRPHYCLLKNVNRADFASNDDYIYANIKQELKVKDLNRYSINAVLVDNYSDITKILKDIENRYNKQNVFISGSCSDYGAWGAEEAIRFIHTLSYELARDEYKVISGFGLGVGSAVINGVLDYVFSTDYQAY